MAQVTPEQARSIVATMGNLAPGTSFPFTHLLEPEWRRAEPWTALDAKYATSALPLRLGDGATDAATVVLRAASPRRLLAVLAVASSLRGLLPGPDGAELVVWAIAGNADTDVLRLDVAIVDALAPGQGVVWVTERDVQGKLRALTAIEHAWRGGDALQKIVQLVGTDAAMFAGRDDEAAALLAASIRDSYAARFEGEHHPKALIIESLRAGRPTRVRAAFDDVKSRYVAS